MLIENFRHGTAERFGLGYAELADANPRLIYARVSGFGPGPGAGLPGYDFLVQAMSGLMSITGDPQGPPMKTGVAVVDVLTGLNLTIGVLAAIAERSRSGSGQYLEVSLMGSALAGLVNQASSHLTAGVVPERMGNLHPSIAPYEPFATATDPLVIAVGNDAQFRRLARSLGRPDLGDDARWQSNPDRVRNREALHEEIERSLRDRSRDAWIERLRADGIPCGPINTIADAFAAAETLGLEPRVELSRPGGTEVATTANPIRFSRTPVVYRRPPPFLGEH